MSTRKPELRRAVPGDLAAIKGLLADCGLPTVDLTSQSLEGFHVALAADEMIGVAGIEMAGSYALLRSVAVRPGLRASGLGRRLVAASENLARSRGVLSIYLIPNDDAAKRYFSHLGYAAIDRKQVPPPLTQLAEFTSLCPQTHPCLRKGLDPHVAEEAIQATGSI